MNWLRALFFWRDDRAAIAPLVAVAAAALVASTALALDVGVYYVGNRDLRSATEAAALSAAIDPYNAEARARAYLASNGYPEADLQSIQVEVGRYCADISMAAGTRFVPMGSNACPGNGLSTAVRLHTTKASRQYFAGVFGALSPIPLMSATATAARVDEAGLGITTGVLGLSGLTASVVNLVNAILSKLLGITLNLDSSQLSALLATNVDAATFFHTLAAGDDDITYGEVASSTVTLTQLLAAAQAASGSAPPPALTGALAKFASAGGLQIPLAGLFDLGVWEKIPVGDASEQQNLKAGLNAYQLITYALQAHAGGIDVTLTGTQAGMPALTQVRLIDSWQGQVARARFAFGPQGETRVNTSALRLQLTLKVSGLGTLLAGVGTVLDQLLLAPVKVLLNALVGGVDVPLLIDVGAGSANVASIGCGQESASDARVGVNAQTGLLTAYLGHLPANAMSSTMPAIQASDVGMTDMVNVVGLNVKIKAAVGPVTGTSATLDFRQGNGGNGVIGHPPSPGTSARVGNTAQLGSMLTGLGSNLQVDATLLGMKTGPLVNGLVANVGALVGGLLSALNVDGLVDTLLAALGIQAGFADIWVTGARCGVPVLV
ncbi:MAG: hypothetical protein JWR77_101 [Rhizorhabdus sp.]|nr:hypothetical protein [Rhizorhabdus sp.]